MEPRLIVLSLFALLAGSSGRVFPTATKCTEPLWTVIGNHYVPRESCEVTSHDIEKELSLREMYFKELSELQAEPDVNKTNELLDKIVSLLPTHTQKHTKDFLTCTACAAGVDLYNLVYSQDVEKDQILGVLSKLCIDFNIMTPEICKGMIEIYGKILMKIIDFSWYSTNGICSMLLNTKCGLEDLSELQWNVTLPKTKKPPVVKPVPPPASSRRLKVLHISDTHWDTEYKVGTWAECKLPLCCRKENILPDEKAERAGKYGGWRCDTPEETFDSLLEHIAKQHPDLDYILWTGDIPAHDIWAQSRPSNLRMLKSTVAKLFATFPKTPIFPALGNHESVPANLFPLAKELNNPMDWLFKELSKQWSLWLPQNLTKGVRWGAFYTTLIRPGLRVISMNMNYCYRMNWWLIVKFKDPLDELAWLANVLQESENRGEKVHIIGHVPPGSRECLKTWQKNYYQIINRYEGTVTAQFFGHTHSDEFEVMYDLQNTTRPFGVAYIGPSVTTYMYHNPSYRIYYVEGDHNGTNRFVLDHESWYLNLEEANRQNRAVWRKLYSAKDAYGMTNLYPEDWHNLYMRIKNSDKTLQQYHKYYWNDSPKRPVCDMKCRRNRLCDIRSCDLYGNP